jgi:hypothetical protein
MNKGDKEMGFGVFLILGIPVIVAVALVIGQWIH